MKSIAIFYHDLPLYRFPIFRELCLCEKLKFTLFSEANSSTDIMTINSKFAHIEIENGGLRWKFIKNIWLFNNKFLWQKGVLKICFSNDFDEYIFLGNAYYISTWIATAILRIRHKKVYFWTHGIKKHEKGIKGFIRLIFYHLSNDLLLYGDVARNLLIKQGFMPEKLHVIYNSLDTSKQKELRNTLSKEQIVTFRSKMFNNPQFPQIIFIGRLTEKKKLSQIIEALYILKQKGFFLNLLFVGNGEDKQKLQTLVEEKKINENVFFYGASYNEEDNYKLIASSDLCVSPGEIGLTAMHSLVYGTPVITHNNFEEQAPEVESIISEFSGCFFEQNNIKDLADKIESWLTNHIDKAEIQQNCYSIIDSKYNPENQKEIICNVLMK